MLRRILAALTRDRSYVTHEGSSRGLLTVRRLLGLRLFSAYSETRADD